MTVAFPGSLVVKRVGDPNQPLHNALNENNIVLQVRPSNEFLTLMERLGFTRRGKTSWSTPNVVNGATSPLGARFIKAYDKNFAPNTVFANSRGEVSNYTGYTGMPTEVAFRMDYPIITFSDHYLGNGKGNSPVWHYYGDGASLIARRLGVPHTRDGNLFSTTNATFLKAWKATKKKITFGTVITKTYPTDFSSLVFVVVTLERDQVWVRLRASQDIVDDYRFSLTKMLGMKTARDSIIKPAEAVTALASLRNKYGNINIDEEASKDALEFIEQANEYVLIGSAKNEPANAMIWKGENVLLPTRNEYLAEQRGIHVWEEPIRMPMAEILKVQSKSSTPEKFLIHDSLMDIVSMNNAKIFRGEPRLKPFQKEAVGLHLSTKIGYLQACQPGMGKTVVQLTAMRERAKVIENYRGLVVVESNLPQQWKEEQEVWFPEARSVLIASTTDRKEAIKNLEEALAVEGPVVVIMTGHNLLSVLQERQKRDAETERYSEMSVAELVAEFAQQKKVSPTVARMILDTYWNDLCSDESTTIRTGNSKQNDALWILRQNAEVATALTGTPINTSIDDVARLLAWVRNDKNLFSNKLSTLYDPTDPESAAAMFQSLGPIIFRRDTSEEESMPDVADPIVFSITPKPAERALVVAAERELRRCYSELVTALGNLEGTAGIDEEELAATKAALAEARGAWLGGTQLARMASSDAATLLDSDSVGAALLISQGLVDNAVNAGSSKQEKLIEDLLPRIQRGQQALVFTEFSSVATRLVDALEENGIRAREFTGRNPRTRDAGRVAFQNGEIDVLVLTRAGTRGLTLHKASVLYHYDLPWTVERIIQRTGRGVRIGSENALVESIYLILEGTVEQRMAEHLVALSVASSLVLDHSRGADMSNNSSVTAMKGLISNVVRTTEKSSFKMFGELLGLEESIAA